MPSDGDIHRILEQRVQAIAGPEGGMGIVVGVLDEKGPRVVAYGDAGGSDRRPLNGDTVFEIASVSKVFTALLLADMVRTGDLALTDPAAKYLPPSNGLSMTLVDLATHTAGLPFMPDNLTALMEAPAASYSKSDLYGFIASRPLSDGHRLQMGLFEPGLLAAAGGHRCPRGRRFRATCCRADCSRPSACATQPQRGRRS